MCLVSAADYLLLFLFLFLLLLLVGAPVVAIYICDTFLFVVRCHFAPKCHDSGNESESCECCLDVLLRNSDLLLLELFVFQNLHGVLAVVGDPGVTLYVQYG